MTDLCSNSLNFIIKTGVIKMADRARKTKTRPTTIASRVREYLKKYPDETPVDVAAELGVSVSAVYSTINYDRKHSGQGKVTFTIKDVNTIKEMGVAKAKQIIKLLESL